MILKANPDLKAAFHLDQFRVLQPQIKVLGIWRTTPHTYFLVCPEMTRETKIADGRLLADWFDNEFREMAFSLELVARPPATGVQLRNRSADEVARSGGVFRNISFVLSDLAIELSDAFPDFGVLDAPTNKFVVERLLTELEFAELEKVFSQFAYPWDVEVIVDKAMMEKARVRRETKPDFSGLDSERRATIEALTSPYTPLTAARFLRSDSVSAALRNALREDEKFWIDRRKTTFGADVFEGPTLTKGDFESLGMIDLRSNSPGHINNYYSLFNHLVLILPDDRKTEEQLSRLNVSVSELQSLAEKKRLTLVLPKNFQSYSSQLIGAVAEANSSSLILPRKLTTLIVNDAKMKFPLLYPPLDFEQMAFLLGALQRAADQISDAKFASVLRQVIIELQHAWLSTSTEFPYKATDSIQFSGVGRILAALWSVDDPLQQAALAHSLLSVQIASSLNAVQVPDARQEKIVSAGSSLYTGVNRKQIPSFDAKLEAIVEGLFTVSSKIPVNDFVEAFDSSDINKLRKLITDISKRNASVEDAAEIAKRFNLEARKFETRKEFRGNLDLLGLLTGLYDVGFVPPITWITSGLRYLFRKENSGTATAILDTLEAIARRTDPRVVLVGRLKKDLFLKT